MKKMEERNKKLDAEQELERDKLLKELQSTSLSNEERKEKESRLNTIETILKAMKEVTGKPADAEKLRVMKRQMAEKSAKAFVIALDLWSHMTRMNVFLVSFVVRRLVNKKSPHVSVRAAP